jgi:hypothetical protein
LESLFPYSMYCQFSHSICICNSFALQGRNLQLLKLRSYPQILLILCQMTKFRRLLCFFSRLKASQSIWTFTLFLMSKRVHSMFLPLFSKSMLIQNVPLRFPESPPLRLFCFTSICCSIHVLFIAPFFGLTGIWTRALVA